jgi:hypothetical protein
MCGLSRRRPRLRKRKAKESAKSISSREPARRVGDSRRLSRSAMWCWCRIRRQRKPPFAKWHFHRQVRATADRADYDGATEMHLTGAPRVQMGPGYDREPHRFCARATETPLPTAMCGQLDGQAAPEASASGSSRRLDFQVRRCSGWFGIRSGGNGACPCYRRRSRAAPGDAGSGLPRSGRGKGKPRALAGGNSISAPLITLNRQKQTLVRRPMERRIRCARCW